MKRSAARTLARTAIAGAAVTVLCVSLGVAEAAQPEAASAAVRVPSYSMAVEGRTWRIDNPDGCNETIGSGGTLLERGYKYYAKCQGAGEPPRATGYPGSKALTFRTDKDYRYPGAIVEDRTKNTWKDAAGNTLRDRSEIATPWDLPLHTDVWVGFDIRIPAGVDDVSSSGAYLLQLWQCSANPIAGVRIQAWPGNGHNVQFVRRGEAPNVNYNEALATKSVGVSEWHSFVIKYRVEPYRSGGPKGTIAVYHKKVGATGGDRKLFEKQEYFGYATRSRCAGDTYSDKFRVRFGMYKDYQPGATFRADFRNVRIGGSKAEVQPYDRG